MGHEQPGLLVFSSWHLFFRGNIQLCVTIVKNKYSGGIVRSETVRLWRVSLNMYVCRRHGNTGFNLFLVRLSPSCHVRAN